MALSLWKPPGDAGALPDQFPARLRVLVVDDDPACLMIIEKMLKKCNYEAIICNKAEIGLALLRENKNVCDIVLSDVHMPDMDGFKLLEIIGLEMDIPVIMMSTDSNPGVMMKGVTHGACDYIIKPVRMEALQAIWQHVVRRKKPKCKECQLCKDCRQKYEGGNKYVANVNQNQKLIEDVEYASPGNEGHNGKIVKRRKDEDLYVEPGESSSSKKPRVVWTVELHQKFVAAVNHLGIDRCVPKKILELMNVPGITRENIASHLQKYRLYLKRINENQISNSPDDSFMDFLSRGYELRALAGRGQLAGQHLSPLQASVLDRLTNSRSSVPTPGQLLLEDPRFHGNPTNMEPKQFLSLNQSHQCPLNGVNSQALVPMTGQGSSQHFFQNGMLAQGTSGSNVSGSGMLPGYNYLNGPNKINPDPVPQNMTFTDWLTYPTSPIMGSIIEDDENETHGNNNGDNQHDILSALLDQPLGGIGQQGNELEFDGYTFDDLPRAT